MWNYQQTVRFLWLLGSRCGFRNFYKRIFYRCEIREIVTCTDFADNSRNCRRIIVRFFWEAGRLTGKKPIYFGADPDYDPHPGILTEFLPVRDGTVVRISLDQLFGSSLRPQSDSISLLFSSLFHRPLRTSTSTLGPRTFCSSGPSSWNALPRQIRDPATSINIFR